MYRQRLGQAITQCLRYLYVYMVNLSFALSTPNQFNPRPPQTCFQNMQINERDTRNRNSSWNWDTDTQTEIETQFQIETELAVRYLWDTRARRELSNAISRPAGSSFWRLSLLTLRRRRRVSFGVWKSRQFHLSRAKNETYPTDTQYDAATTKIQ